MKVTNQLMRIIKEEIELLDYGKVTISINVAGPYVELSSEKRIRVVKSGAEDEVDVGNYHKG